jgi:Gram-negative bacterial TonB protein C-terminal
MRQRIVSAAAILVTVALVCPGCAGVGRALRVGEDAPWGPALVPSGRDDYPRLAKDLGLTGRVGLGCGVDARGSAREVVILESGGLVLDDAARKLFSEGHFLIPPDWSASGGPGKRFLYGVIFQLRGKAEVARFADNRLTVIITGSGTS